MVLRDEALPGRTGAFDHGAGARVGRAGIIIGETRLPDERSRLPDGESKKIVPRVERSAELVRTRRTMKNVSKLVRTHIDRLLLEGSAAHLPKAVTFVLDGKLVGPATLAPVLKKRIEAADKVAQAKGAWLSAVMEERAILEETDALVALYRQALLLMFHSDDVVLAGLGLSRRKPPRRLTAEERVLKAERARATREARGTKGPRQREKIRGDAAVREANDQAAEE